MLNTKKTILLGLAVLVIPALWINGTYVQAALTAVKKVMQKGADDNSVQNDIQSLQRGKIFLADGTVLADGLPVYKLLVDAQIGDTDFEYLRKPLEHMVTLDKQAINTRRKYGYIPVSYSITQEQADAINRVISEHYSSRSVAHQPFFVQFSGYKRTYPQKDFLSPYLGHIRKTETSKGLTRPMGVNGIEGYYDETLSSDQNITLSINADKQRALENEVDKLQHDLNKEEVSSVLINLESGYVESIASSDRRDPKLYYSFLRIYHARPSIYARPTLIQDLFPIGDFYKPIHEAMKKAHIKAEDFGLMESSHIDLQYERKPLQQDGVLKINCMQLVRVYSIFYNDGKLKDFKIAKTDKIPEKQVIDKKLADEIKKQLPKLYETTENKKVVLEFDDYQKTASIKIDYIEDGNQRYLKAYFMVDKR